jgi:RNA polymerase sigma-70 factor (ECF subfamily)
MTALAPLDAQSPRATIAALYDAHRVCVTRYLYRRCGDTGLAEDLTAETFACALATLLRKPPPSSAGPWLIGIATHKLMDHWRRRDREQRTLRAIEFFDSSVDPNAAVSNESCLDAFAQLDRHYREALVLRYCDGLSVPDVAERLDRTVHSTESLLARARCAFRKSCMNFVLTRDGNSEVATTTGMKRRHPVAAHLKGDVP